jgi:hypothetical protein
MSESAFTESPGRYLVELPEAGNIDALTKHFAGVADITEVGLTQHFKKLTITTQKDRVMEISLEELTAAWRGTLDW